MPSILIESGFLSNTQDEKYLKSVKGQNDIARAIVESIKQYKTLYEKSLSDKK